MVGRQAILISDFTFFDKNEDIKKVYVLKILPFVLKLSSKENMIFQKFKNSDKFKIYGKNWSCQNH
jgi:membrane-bound acyltransferase YfiQ involved in biofilm formation